MLTLALLTTALLFGGMTLYAAGLAPFLFAALPAETAGPVLRKAFPHFHLFVIVAAAAGAALLSPFDPVAALLLALVAATTLPTRQLLTPAINRATDAGQRARFHRLHGLSVAVTLSHIAIAGYVLGRFVGADAA
jgi:hypothetical protein